jgi:pimeloyl-ACP methyl ester carboxylesterase
MSPRKSYGIDSLLSTHLCLSPRIFRDRVIFISDLSGRLSLYGMSVAGGAWKPLLPPGVALQNPAQMYGASLFLVVPGMERILIALDSHGDELYQPYLIPMDGGSPEPLFPGGGTPEVWMPIGLNAGTSTVYFRTEEHRSGDREIVSVDLRTLEVKSFGKSPLLMPWVCADAAHAVVITCDQYAIGDEVLYRWSGDLGRRVVLAGTPQGEREADYRNLSFDKAFLTEDGASLCMKSSLFSDTYSPCLLDLASARFRDVPVRGINHTGVGELKCLERLSGDDYLLEYNIDGCSHGYLGVLDFRASEIRVSRKICGDGELSEGVLHSFDFVRTPGDAIEGVLSFSTATSPVQLFRVRLGEEQVRSRLTDERLQGIDERVLSGGEDASCESFDGLRISARLYLPSPETGFAGQRPLIVYIHGGPQSQERPDFTWFSMPLIQYLTLNGFAVFVPNVRGSSGYGYRYSQMVHRDWGGNDRLDHLWGVKFLERDGRIDSTRRGVVGRSYGGFMSMCLMTRHPGVFQAGVDLFGLCDLIGFTEGMPEPTREYIYRVVGDPAAEDVRRRLVESSPVTHFSRIQDPVLFVQGVNDPRALPQLTLRYVETLRRMGKDVELLAFEDEGHDVIKLKNKAVCYQRVVDFFKEHLEP